MSDAKKVPDECSPEAVINAFDALCGSKVI